MGLCRRTCYRTIGCWVAISPPELNLRFNRLQESKSPRLRSVINKTIRDCCNQFWVANYVCIGVYSQTFEPLVYLLLEPAEIAQIIGHWDSKFVWRVSIERGRLEIHKNAII